MVQAAQAQHDKDLASHMNAYTELNKEVVIAQKQLEQQAESMAGLQALLTKVQPLQILLFAIPISHPLTHALTMLPCCSVPVVLNRRSTVSKLCISCAV